MNLKDKALEYLGHYVSVIPVSRDKKPLVKWQEYQKRLPTQEEVIAWWQKYPEANIGVITGKISNITVVDVEAGGDISQFPETTIVRTGGGGWHLYYQYDSDVNNKARILPLTDIRGEGGYVVAPPSIHASGRPYEILSKKPMVPFPREMFGLPVLVGRNPHSYFKSQNWKEIVNGIPEGSRNEMAAKLVGKLLRTFPQSEWEDSVWILFAKWNESNQPPLSENELRTIFNSISKRELYKPAVKEPEEITEKIKFYSLTEVFDRSYNELINTKPSDIISFGYDFLDNKLTGIFKSDLIVLGGETGIGKTTFATNIIYKASKQHKCCIFALEDRLENYGIKAMYFEMGRQRKEKGLLNYPWNDYRRNDIADPNFPDYLLKAKEKLNNNNVIFAEAEEQIKVEVLERLLKQKVEEGIELFLIDHLHYFDLLRGDSNKADYIEKTMVMIKTIQKKTGARIILVVHYKKLEGRKPAIDSFKDSISIPQNADYVLNLWRDRSLGANQNMMTIMCPKSRNPNGEFTIEVIFNPLVNDFIFQKEEFGTITESMPDIIEEKLF